MCQCAGRVPPSVCAARSLTRALLLTVVMALLGSTHARRLNDGMGHSHSNTKTVSHTRTATKTISQSKTHTPRHGPEAPEAPAGPMTLTLSHWTNSGGSSCPVGTLTVSNRSSVLRCELDFGVVWLCRHGAVIMCVHVLESSQPGAIFQGSDRHSVPLNTCVLFGSTGCVMCTSATTCSLYPFVGNCAGSSIPVTALTTTTFECFNFGLAEQIYNLHN